MISGTPAHSKHLVQFYDEDRFPLESVAHFVGSGLDAGDVVIAIATDRHLADLEELLTGWGFDIAGPRADGRYLTPDAFDTLSAICSEGKLDSERFADVVGASLVRPAADLGPPVRIFGEMVALLWENGKPEQAIRLEELWNELGDDVPFSLLCAYPIGHFASEAQGRWILWICAEHGEVVDVEGNGVGPMTKPSEERPQPLALEEASSRQRENAVPDQGPEPSSRLAAIVESAEDAIIGKTLDGVVTNWNRAAERIFGFSAEEMIGESISRIIPPERHEDLPMILEAVRRGERVDHYETERVRKDGRRIFVALTVSPICDEQGRVIGVSKIARDVTERRRLDQQREVLAGLVQRSHAELEASSRTKDEFLATLGHELRNPLAAVLNAIESAQLDPAMRERALELASRQTGRLSRLVDDLLDVAQITRGGVRLNRETVALAEILRHAVESTQFTLEEHGHTLSLSLPSDAVRIDGDPIRLEQVLVNLLNNAAKYTPRGGRIGLCGWEEGSEAVIRVRDNGLGIAPEALARIFEPFVRAPNDRDRSGGGLGVGLTVARSFVVLHGGRIEAFSEGPGTGASFVVRLPLASAATSQRPPRHVAVMPHVSGVPILVVDDNPDVAEGVAMLLEAAGHRVRVALDGPTALEAARAEAPTLMLVDIGLPGMDGYEVAQRVRRELPEIVLVALTGYGLEEDCRRALAAGFDHYLTKPVASPVLRNLVARICARRREAVEGAGSATPIGLHGTSEQRR